jgi:hypothetical protein
VHVYIILLSLSLCSKWTYIKRFLHQNSVCILGLLSSSHMWLSSPYVTSARTLHGTPLPTVPLFLRAYPLPRTRVYGPLPSNGHLFWLYYSGLSATMSQYISFGAFRSNISRTFPGFNLEMNLNLRVLLFFLPTWIFSRDLPYNLIVEHTLHVWCFNDIFKLLFHVTICLFEELFC